MKFLKDKMEVKMKKLNCLLIFMAFSLLLSAQEIPLKISYQGKLFDSGIPVNDTKKIKFMIGSSWEETHENVEIVGGLYSVTLGSINPIPYTLFDDNPSLQLEIKVGETTLSPNTDILSSPYAFKAEKAVDTEKLNGQEPSYYQNWYNLNNIPSDIADGDDVDDAIDGIGSPQRRTRTADHLDTLDILQHQILLAPEDSGEQRRVQTPAVDQHLQFVGEATVETTGGECPFVGIDPPDL